ncbi:methyltransferase [Fragilaria crotonensis]|nr:methyltransferase [Fragilaria crotonensis]
MLAPRKILWSTPREVVPILVDWIPLEPNDVILDVGCGDAKVLLQWAMQVPSSLHLPSRQQQQQPQESNSTIKFLGIEIDEQRAAQAQENVENAYREGILDRDKVSIQIRCGNALHDASDWWVEATIVFMYLIPRGLRRIKPMLELSQQQKQHESTRHGRLVVVTYMSPLPDERHVAKRSCPVEHQPGAAWPLFLYHLDKKGEYEE